MLNALNLNSSSMPSFLLTTHLQTSLRAVGLLCLRARILRTGGLSANALAFAACHYVDETGEKSSW